MRSRWLVAVAVLGGVAAATAVGWVSLVLAAGAVYDTLTPFVPYFLVIFTVLTVTVGLLVARKRTPLWRGLAAGLLIGWATIAIWVMMGAPGAERSP